MTESPNANLVIDILKMELDQGLPYWLSPEGRGATREAIRAKHRNAYLAKMGRVSKGAASVRPLTEAEGAALDKVIEAGP